MTTQVFFDPSGRRSLWTRRFLGILLASIIIAAIAFATTLVSVPRERDLALPLPEAHAGKLRIAESVKKKLLPWLPRQASANPHTPLSIGFYVPGDDASLASLRRHVSALDWVVPATITVSGPKHQINVATDPNFNRMIAAMPHPPKILPMVQNFMGEDWDGTNAAALLHDPSQRSALVFHLSNIVRAQKAAGLVMDFETLPDAAMPDYLRFLTQLHDALPKGAQLAVTAPAGDEAWPLVKLGKVADRLILMAYDQHWEGDTPGPIAAQDWFVKQVEAGLRAVGRDRLVVALGSYAYDWHGDTTDALSIEDAWLSAHDSSAPVPFDQNSGNAGFAYEEAGERHQVWMLDAATSWNQMQVLRKLGIDDVAVWRLGSEDPGFWSALSAYRSGGHPDIRILKSLLNTDVEGTGEILRITATPTIGQRALVFDAQGLIRDEHYQSLPTPYVVQRTGAAQKMLALTFDDGPDATWTPKILDALEAARAPGTFFVIGENGLEHPQLLNRIITDGSEIGNHTYTHPNLALASPAETRLQLNATQRMIEAYTGRSTRLFRAPYFGDAEPTTADEIGPALEAQKAGYTVVGLHVDPNDWQRPGADAIVRQVVEQVHAATPTNSANIILLHDGGGDRSQTVAALPRIIATLKNDGYRFVTVSQLVGQPQSAANPPVTAGDLFAVRTDIAIFILLATMATILVWIFYLAISLGIGRAILMTALAWIQSRRKAIAPPDHCPSVSVIIPAFNEERVIEASVRRVLASAYPGIAVMVVDDGSKDQTSAIIASAFANDPRVTLLTLENGGKAAALNSALRQTDGEIVIALDADTEFEPETIGRLARWFADPRIGAVAGDARVGNRVNLVTRWQAVEYITAQNLERRALAGFDAMTVVPGAVGAWRRAALEAVNGYPEDTLAEDQDLTIAIQRAGWRVTYDPEAVAWTEAPESFKALAKQRYRWAFGTLQCLWKHGGILRMRRPTGLALVGLPQAWLFQIAFAAISPLIDLTLLLSIAGTVFRVFEHGWAQTRGDVGEMGLFWLAFTTIDILCGWVAYRLDARRQRYPALLLVAQRLVYRQIMYWVVLRAIASAIGGWLVGWGKLERTGRVATSPQGPGS